MISSVASAALLILILLKYICIALSHVLTNLKLRITWIVVIELLIDEGFLTTCLEHPFLKRRIRCFIVSFLYVIAKGYDKVA